MRIYITYGIKAVVSEKKLTEAVAQFINIQKLSI